MSDQGRVYAIETFGTVDGPGIRYIVFLQGCPLRCQYCHNRDSWDPHQGKETTVKDLVEDIKKYVPYMKASGGGVTFSGGEPTLQLSFLTALARELKALDIHLALDTSGYFSVAQAQELLNYIDLVILDLKEFDPQAHVSLTGVKNDRILQTAQELSAMGMPLWIRHVVVPTLTDQQESLEAMGEFLTTLGSLKQVELLPYHSMGKFKWSNVRCSYPLENIPDATQKDILRSASYLEKFRLPLKLNQ